MAWYVFKYRSNLYLVLHGLLIGVLGLLLISFYVSYRAVGLKCQAFRHTLFILLGGEL